MGADPDRHDAEGSMGFLDKAKQAANEMAARADETGRPVKDPWDEMTLTYGG